MTAIAAVYTPEGFVIAADGLRRDGETLEPVSDCAQKIFWGAHPNFVFAYAWTGTVGLRLPTGEFVSLIDVANQVCQGRSKTRPVGRSKSRPVVGGQVVEYSGEDGRWSVAEAALLPRGAFGGRVSVRKMGDVCGGSA